MRMFVPEDDFSSKRAGVESAHTRLAIPLSIPGQTPKTIYLPTITQVLGGNPSAISEAKRDVVVAYRAQATGSTKCDTFVAGRQEQGSSIPALLGYPGS